MMADNSAAVKGGRGRGRGKPKGAQASGPVGIGEEERKTGEPYGVKLPSRPDDGGEKGRVMPVYSNHFRLTLDNHKLTVHQYHVECKHERKALNKEETRKVFWTCANDNRATTFHDPKALAFDGGKMAFSLKRVVFPGGEDDTFQFSGVEVTLPRDTRPSACSVLWQYVGEIQLDLASSKEENLLGRSMTPIQVVDVIFRQSNTCPYLQNNFIPAGSNFYCTPYEVSNPERSLYKPADLSRGMEIWNGYYSSAHVLSGAQAWMNVDVAHTVFYRSISVLDFMREVLVGRLGGRSPWAQTPLPPDAAMGVHERKMLEKEISGLRVRIIHRGTGDSNSNGRVYKVNGVTTESAEELKFKFLNKETSQEEVMTVADYFEKLYKGLTYRRLPCLRVGSKSRGCFMPLEVCEIDKGQKCNKKLLEDQTRVMIKHCAVPAPERFNRIRQMIEASGLQTDSFASRFGLHFEAKQAEIQARAIEPPTIQYGPDPTNRGDTRRTTVVPKDGSWRRQNHQLLVGATVNYWGLMSFVDARQEGVLQEFCVQLARMARSMGMQFADFPTDVKYVRPGQEIEPTFNMMMAAAMERTGAPPDLIVCVMPAKNSITYAEIKRISEIQLGVMTQVLQYKNVEIGAHPNPKSAQLLENIIFKINMKRGGINSAVANCPLPQLSANGTGTLVLGVDVTHPSPLDKRSPSIAAVVGNVDLEGTVYGGSAKLQKHRRESIVYLTDAVRDRLMAFYLNTKVKPSSILVYRDGVSEGQFLSVVREELKGIKDACQALDANYKPMVTFVIVQKRHHTRFLCANQRDMCGRAQNVPPGTVVDTVIVHPHEFDFYLCSHFGLMGTSRPAHYHVLHDENGFTSDSLQKLTYQLCHLYGRCTRPVSIPAPTYYADLVCTRARSHLLKTVGDYSSDAMSSTSGEEETLASVPEAELIRAVTLKSTIAGSMYFA